MFNKRIIKYIYNLQYLLLRFLIDSKRPYTIYILSILQRSFEYLELRDTVTGQDNRGYYQRPAHQNRQVRREEELGCMWYVFVVLRFIPQR